jgi:hypothetical protein
MPDFYTAESERNIRSISSLRLKTQPSSPLIKEKFCRGCVCHLCGSTFTILFYRVLEKALEIIEYERMRFVSEGTMPWPFLVGCAILGWLALDWRRNVYPNHPQSGWAMGILVGVFEIGRARSLVFIFSHTLLGMRKER